MSSTNRITFRLAAALLLLTTPYPSSSGLFCNALSTPVKTTPTHSIPTSKTNPSTSIKSTAAILNINARSVSPSLIALTRQILGDENVHVTTTAQEARNAARHVIASNYSLVVPMGGDGTLSCWIDNLVDEVMEQHEVNGVNGSSGRLSVEEAIEKLPVIGYVPRGTGNGLGHVVGCWQVDGDVKLSQDINDGQTKKSLLSRINLLSRRKQKRQERTKGLLLRLKEVGDLLQQQRMQELDSTSNDSSKLQLENELSNKCTIIEMPMMEVIHKEDHHSVTPTTSVNSTTSPTTNLKGDLCFFAGSGFDSLMLHDFQQIKAWSSTSKSLPGFIKDALSSVAGYCVALVTMTLPQTVRYGTHNIRVRVTTRDEGVLWVDHRRGDFSELAVNTKTTTTTTITSNQDEINGNTSVNGNNQNPKKKSHLLYSGKTGILCASTTPYYGGGLRLFPYARLIPQKLQLRIGRISPLVGFINIPKIFEGSYREKSDRFGCLDFVGEEFTVEVGSLEYEEYLKRRRRRGRGGGVGGWWRRIRGVAKVNEEGEGNVVPSTATTSGGFPFQHSGESMGIKERFRVRVVKQPVRFVSFLRPRVVVDE